MINHTENENINENKDHLEKGVQGEKQFPAMPKPEDVGELPAIKIQKAIESLKIQTGQTVIVEQVVGMWDVFKIQNLTGKKYYSDVGDVESHFLNWITKKKFDTDAGGKNTDRVTALRNWVNQFD